MSMMRQHLIRPANVSLDGKGPIYRNVTKEYAPQIAKAEGKNLAAAAGKEGVGGEAFYQDNEKILWDSWWNYEKVTAHGQVYAKVGYRLYSKHAVDRMQPSGNRFGPYIYQAGGDYGRSVAPQHVEDVIRSVAPIVQENGNLAYKSGSLVIITSVEGEVVTIMTYR